MVGGKRLALALGALSLSVGGWGFGMPSADAAPGDDKDAHLSWDFSFTSLVEHTGAPGPTVTCTIRAFADLEDYLGAGWVYVDDPDPACQPRRSEPSNAVTRATISYEDRHGNPSEALASGFGFSAIQASDVEKDMSVRAEVIFRCFGFEGSDNCWTTRHLVPK